MIFYSKCGCFYLVTDTQRKGLKHFLCYCKSEKELIGRLEILEKERGSNKEKELEEGGKK